MDHLACILGGAASVLAGEAAVFLAIVRVVRLVRKAYSMG